MTTDEIEFNVHKNAGATMNDSEREVIILNAAWEMIDGMVNWAMFVKIDHIEPSNLMFHTSTHARLFAILLGDFLSEIRAFRGDPLPLGLKPAPNNARPSDLTRLIHEGAGQGLTDVA